MNKARSIVLLTAAAGIIVVPGAARLPPAMASAGQWDVARSADGSGSKRLCLADPGILSQWEHRRSQCSRSILSSAGDLTVVQYNCAGGEFGTSKVRVLTPRSLRIETQGISKGYPFAYVLHARRVGDCPIH